MKLSLVWEHTAEVRGLPIGRSGVVTAGGSIHKQGSTASKLLLTLLYMNPVSIRQSGLADKAAGQACLLSKDRKIG